VLASEFFNERNPKPCIMLEFFEFEWINDITKRAGDHYFLLYALTEFGIRDSVSNIEKEFSIQEDRMNKQIF